MDLTALIAAPTIMFLLFVAPVWVIMHYRTKRQSQSALADGEREELKRLVEAAGRMESRIETLESILDAETPDWRRRVDRDH